MKNVMSNAAAIKQAKQSVIHLWEGDAYNTEWCKKKREDLAKEGKKSFYKKTGDKYSVFSF